LTSLTRTGTGTVTFQKVRTGTVNNHGSGTQTRYKKNYVFDFLHSTFFSFTFYNILMKLIFRIMLIQYIIMRGSHSSQEKGKRKIRREGNRRWNLELGADGKCVYSQTSLTLM
jgi:hypothetical protein